MMARVEKTDNAGNVVYKHVFAVEKDAHFNFDQLERTEQTFEFLDCDTHPQLRLIAIDSNGNEYLRRSLGLVIPKF
jgi:hypothetical protein